MSHLGPQIVTVRSSPQRAVFFDLYGTLIDIRTDEDDPWVYATLAQYLAYRRVWITPAELQREYRSRVRACLNRSPERFPEVDVCRVFEEIVAEYRRPRGDGVRDPVDPGEPIAVAALFRTLTRRQFCAFPDVYQVLERLETRYRLGLISDAQWVFTEPELEMTGLDRFFPVRVLSSRVGVKKPDPRLFAQAMRALGAAPEASVYVGDNPPRDLAGARNAGMHCVIFRSQNVRHDGLIPDATFNAYQELEPIVERLIGP